VCCMHSELYPIHIIRSLGCGIEMYDTYVHGTKAVN
jgi:hypothetical protein